MFVLLVLMARPTFTCQCWLLQIHGWMTVSIDVCDQVHVIIMPDYSVMEWELESFVDRLYCHTPVPPDDPASTSNSHHGIEGDEVKDEAYDDYSSDEAILRPQYYVVFSSHQEMLLFCVNVIIYSSLHFSSCDDLAYLESR